MKLQFIAFLFVLLIGRTQPAYAQYLVEIREVALMKTSNLSKGVTCGETTNKILQTLGKPSKIEDYFFETEDRNGKIYHYGSNKLYIIGDTLVSFEITDPTITVGAGKGKTFRINDKIKTGPRKILTKNSNSSKTETIQSFIGFPVSPDPGHSFNVDYKSSILLWLKHNSQPLDSSLSLLFNDQDELIHIHLQE
ncbi:hypothetical protein [Dyadobacter sp. NIV53]|uniref:hypothetical protein n=1 Tax=Dyadobacter sp. NIV53 TaxID=2861765 RepID=UPI001C86C799|nr:hypothetical protein [Dyadobacter sp. NIV53]